MNSESKAPLKPTLHVAPSPHLSDTGITTRWMMMDVMIGLLPAIVVSVFIFHWYAVLQIGVCVLSCLGADCLFANMRGKPASLGDGSASVTGIILALSLPWSAPWYIGVIGSFAAIGLGKAAFGGLGFNLFNPAMVGRAFVMLSFAKSMNASAYVVPEAGLSILTQATPMAAARETGLALGAESLWPMFLGTVNGSLGETSAVALLVGGIYLCIRRSASWEIPAGVLAGAVVFAGLVQVLGLSTLTVPQHLFGGALIFGAFFIATDPVSSPVTFSGKWIFGLGIGIIVVALRTFSSYPEGVMFAVLLMNAATPLINRWTVPKPVGGPVPAPQPRDLR